MIEKLTKARLQLILVVTFVVALFVLSQWIGRDPEVVSVEGSADTKLTVETMVLRAEDIPLALSTNGTVNTRDQLSVVPQVSGRVEWINPDFTAGGRFKADEPLFRIEPIDFELAVQNANADVERTRTALEVIRAEASLAREEWFLLGETEEPPPLVARTPQLREAEAAVKAAESRLSSAKLNLQRTNYRFAQDGLVTTANLAVGQFVQAGQSYGQVYYASSLQVEVPIETRLLRWFNPRNEVVVQLSLESQDQEPFTGQIVRIANALDASTRLSRLYIKPDEEALNQLQLDDFVNVNLAYDPDDLLWVIPPQAIQDQNRLWQVTDSQQLQAQPINILLMQPQQIIAEATQAELTVVLGSVPAAADGMAVNVIESATDPSAAAAR